MADSATVVARFLSGRKRRISIDAIVSFKVGGKTFTGKVLRTQWNGSGKPMTYIWKSLKGSQQVTTEGIPSDLKVLADAPAGHRLAVQKVTAGNLGR